ncbi:MAG TPA: hypothetical protein VFF06_29725 [Polyangia bacterium]|nr:hypothetical protein [Polyangia bacterium]
MTPGDDCLSCHRAGGSARAFTIAGTAYSRGDAIATEGTPDLVVVITDARDQRIELQTNAAGNFYTDQAVAFPVAAELHRGDSVRHMEPRVSTGACSSCHAEPPRGGAAGRVFIAPESAAPPLPPPIAP